MRESKKKGKDTLCLENNSICNQKNSFQDGSANNLQIKYLKKTIIIMQSGPFKEVPLSIM